MTGPRFHGFRIAVDDQGAMKLDALGAALGRCEGPAIVVTQAG